MSTSPSEAPSKRLVFICTHSFAMRTLYKGLFPYFTKKGYQVEAITGDDEFIGDLPEEHFGNVKPMVINMERMPSAVDDFKSLIQLIKHFSQNRYDLIHVSTPKASLLCSIAAKLTGNGPVIFVYRRCVYETKTGIKRSILRLNDQFTAALCRRVVPISKQLRDFLIAEKVSSKTKTVLVGEGSSNGIDVRYFKSTPETQAAAAQFRLDHNIAPAQPVLLYLGRLIHEKGVDFLPDIFTQAKAKLPELKIIVAGPAEQDRDPVAQETLDFLTTNPDVIRLDYVADPRSLYEAADLFCFPSHFEGYGNVMLEASAMGIPSVGFDVPGVQEAIAHDVSGRLSAFGDTQAMADDIIDILGDETLYARLRSEGLERIHSTFGQDAFFALLDTLFHDVMAESQKK